MYPVSDFIIIFFFRCGDPFEAPNFFDSKKKFNIIRVVFAYFFSLNFFMWGKWKVEFTGEGGEAFCDYDSLYKKIFILLP